MKKEEIIFEIGGGDFIGKESDKIAALFLAKNATSERNATELSGDDLALTLLAILGTCQ